MPRCGVHFDFSQVRMTDLLGTERANLTDDGRVEIFDITRRFIRLCGDFHCELVRSGHQRTAADSHMARWPIEMKLTNKLTEKLPFAYPSTSRLHK